MKSLIMAVIVGLATLGSAQAAQVTIGTDEGLVNAGRDNQGWWRLDAANGNPTNDNYYTGGDVRSYFTFDLSGITPGTITGLVLELRRYIQDAPVDLEFWDVSTSAVDLAQRNTVDNAIHADLGTGASYGSATVLTGGSFDVLSFTLNAAAVADANAASGGYFSVGAAVNGPGAIFSYSSDEASSGGVGYTQQLIINPVSSVPLPAGILLLSGGLGALTLGRRRKS